MLISLTLFPQLINMGSQGVNSSLYRRALYCTIPLVLAQLPTLLPYEGGVINILLSTAVSHIVVNSCTYEYWPIIDPHGHEYCCIHPLCLNKTCHTKTKWIYTFCTYKNKLAITSATGPHNFQVSNLSIACWQENLGMRWGLWCLYCSWTWDK